VKGEVKPAMDGMRKLVSAGLRAQAMAEPHPDAEVLSAFAERALPDIQRKAVLKHLSGCSNCRDVVFLSLPDSAEAQNVLALPSRRFTRFALSWGTLAAAVAVCAVLFVGTRHRGEVANYKVAAPAKAPGQMAADLKTPADVAEMHALRDDRVTTRTGTVRELERDKVIPTPKHMTAKPAGKFDFDQNGQVRLAPGSNANQAYSLETPSRSFTAANSRTAGAPASAPAAPSGVIGGLVQSQNAISSVAGQGQGAGVLQAKGNLAGTISDASGAVIPNATVTMVGPVGTRAVQSDRQGQFKFNQLSEGSYSVRAAAPGFQAKELQQVAVLDGKASNVQVTLDVGRTSETVEVSAAAEVATEPAANDQLQAQLQVPASQAAIASAKQKNEFKKSSVAGYHGALAKALSLAPQWTLSASGALLRSLDSGKSWHAISVGDGAFRALSAIGTHVWVGGQKGILYYSADSGQSWTRVTPAIDGRTLQSDITRVDFVDPLNGTLSTADGQAWSTSDAGQTWIRR
jgi:photosystem II stability/assembly factor-like uncharacterized protein